MMGMSIVQWGILAAVAVVAWGVSRNVDGPIIHILLTLLAVWVAKGFVDKMG